MCRSLASMDVRIVNDKTSVIAIRGVLSWLCEGSLMDKNEEASNDAT